MPPRALILSGSLGLGHDMIAAACTEALEGGGWQARTLSSMSLLGPVAGQVGERVFRRLISVPGLYDGLHFAGLRTGSPLAQAMDAASKRRLVPALRSELAAEGAELLVAVFASGASAVAELGRASADRHTCVICNDVTLHRLWVWEGIDLFCVTSPAAAASVRRFLPRAEVAVLPQPVRAQFCQLPSQATARSSLGLAGDGPCALVMGGGWGLGPIVETATLLARAGVQVLAVAGSNRRLERRLRVAAAGVAGVRPFGFTDQVPALMAAADLVVTPAGPTTCSEARAVGRHLLLIDVVPGHGRENLLHELELGGADVSNPEPGAVAASALAILERLEQPTPDRAAAPAWGAELVAALRAVGVKIPA